MIPPIGERVLWTGGDLSSLADFLHEPSVLGPKNSRQLALRVIEALQAVWRGEPGRAFSSEEVTAVEELATALHGDEFLTIDRERRLGLAAVANRIVLGLRAVKDRAP
jgi:hypothetical protein